MAESASSENDDLRYRIRREASGLLAGFRRVWREKRLFRWLCYVVMIAIVVAGIAWFSLTRNLPSADKLLDYEPPLPTMVRGADGDIVYSYARERRVQLRFVDFPKPLIDAFLSAEDKTFWTHGGVDYTGLLGAVVDYVSKLGSGERAKGGSTITQQVAKNILIGDEYSVTRKLKEMILARRIEGVLSKQQILELYLNEIPLGRQSFGVQAAARAYFDKDVADLDLHEAAFLAILPKAPERYGRAKYKDMAITRRNYVLDQMVANGWATRAEADQAKAQPLGLVPHRSESYDPAIGYFVERVRRELIDRYGEKADDGRNSVYAGGLWVRTSLDTEMQRQARDALRAGLLRYHAGKGWRGPIAKIDLDKGDWQSQLIYSNRSINYKDWRVGVVLSRSGDRGTIGFSDGSKADLIGMPDPVKPGHVIAAAPAGSGVYAVRTVPEVSGGMVVEDPQTGRILAMQGGFDSGLGSFNRATQAERQPGSTIKPFVYATALDAGMTPASMVLDGTFCVYQGAQLGQKCFRNFGGEGGGGTHTMRWGLEQSRNLMTIRIASDTGMDKVTRTFKKVGIGDYKNYLSFALGAGETTVQRMVNAYSSLANNGVQYPATLIDYVQDRDGKVIWRADNRRCAQCNAPNWDGKPMPRLASRGKQVMDPRTAYQVVHMLEGVVTRGTAVVMRDLNLPLFGKTGTTNGPTDVWFIGGSQKYVAGAYVGYDKPRSMGGYAQGGRIAAPIIKQFIKGTMPRWTHTPFVAPEGIRMVRIDRVSGKRVFGVEPGSDPKASVIWEAFKPDTEPKRSARSDDLATQRDALLAEIRSAREQRIAASKAAKNAEVRDFAEEQGGVY